jgi:hypothetical protein
MGVVWRLDGSTNTRGIDYTAGTAVRPGRWVNTVAGADLACTAGAADPNRCGIPETSAAGREGRNVNPLEIPVSQESSGEFIARHAATRIVTAATPTSACILAIVHLPDVVSLR